jgi:hypothetical protein
MMTQITKPVHGKASYTEEFKQQALQLWRTSGRSAAKVGAELGSGESADRRLEKPACD